MNGAFGARWLASPEVIIQVLFTSEQPKRNKMASRLASISEKEILSMNEEAVPKNTKMATKFGVTVFNGKLISPASYSKVKNQNTMPCLRKLSSTKNHNENNETSDVFQLGFNNKRNLTQALRKWHRSNLTSACKSFICRQEGETEHFTIKNTLFGQPLIVFCEREYASHGTILFNFRYLFNLCGIY